MRSTLPRTATQPAGTRAITDGALTWPLPRRLVLAQIADSNEDSLRALAARVLMEAGYRILEAASVDEALRVLQARGEVPDLLLTDVVLAGPQGGRVLADQLRERHPKLRVLFMSGYTRNSIVHSGRLDDGVDFLEKPFVPQALLQKVREVLGA